MFIVCLLTQHLSLQNSRSSTKSMIEELQYRLDQSEKEKSSMSAELQLVRDSMSDLQIQCQRYLESKRDIKSTLNETQQREKEIRGHAQELENSLSSERESWQKERTEWEQFQNDLLTTVRVANDFKMEAHTELKRILIEKRALEAQLEKFCKGPGVKIVGILRMLVFGFSHW